jgi:hypothetical protein
MFEFLGPCVGREMSILTLLVTGTTEEQCSWPVGPPSWGPLYRYEDVLKYFVAEKVLKVVKSIFWNSFRVS